LEPEEPEVFTAPTHAAFKAGLQFLVQSPARAVVAADRGMEKEQAGLAVPAAAGDMMFQMAVVVIRHP
jgi:hypothetical protein